MNQKKINLNIYLTLGFNDRVIKLYKKVKNLFIYLAQQNDHAVFT